MTIFSWNQTLKYFVSVKDTICDKKAPWAEQGWLHHTSGFNANYVKCTSTQIRLNFLHLVSNDPPEIRWMHTLDFFFFYFVRVTQNDPPPHKAAFTGLHQPRAAVSSSSQSRAAVLQSFPDRWKEQQSISSLNHMSLVGSCKQRVHLREVYI